MASSTDAIVSEAALRRTVRKDDDDRLKRELLVGQHFLNSEAVAKLSRDELVAYVCLLRSLNGSTASVKTFVSGFNPSNAVLITSAGDNSNASTPISCSAPCSFDNNITTSSTFCNPDTKTLAQVTTATTADKCARKQNTRC